MSHADDDFAIWKKCVHQWFPKLLERTYFVPPIFMNRVQYESRRFSGVRVDIAKPPASSTRKGGRSVLQVSQVREDRAQQRILYCLEKWVEKQKEVMMVMSQLQFGDFLGNPCYSAAASMFPRPIDLRGEHKHRGDFDLLFISRRYGLIVAEIKSIGDRFDGGSIGEKLTLTEKEQYDLVAKKAEQAVKQLQKAEDVLKHLVSDQQHPPSVTKILMLPNVHQLQLKRVLDNCSTLREELCKCLNRENQADVLDVCLCADHLSELHRPWDVSADVLEKLSCWWQKLTSPFGPEHAMSDTVYEDIVTRFCGPATTIQVFCAAEPRVHLRTKGDSVSEIGERFTRLVLYPDQVQILNEAPPLLYITGPPGTGKTVLLILITVHWLRQGHHVHVISTSCDSQAASWLIYNQVRRTVSKEISSRLHFHKYEFDKGTEHVDESVSSLVAAVQDGKLFLIVDEPFIGSAFRDWCGRLHAEVPDLHLWATCVWHNDRPACLTEAQLSYPHRTPPAIAREVQKSCWMGQIENVRRYMETEIPPPTEGTTPWILRHGGSKHQGQSGDCTECGRIIAHVLLDELSVGRGNTAVSPHSPPPLRFRDVFILSWGLVNLHDEETDSAGNVTNPACGLIRGLRAARVPVRVLDGNDLAAIQEVTEMLGPDCAVAAKLKTICGLERKVVVYIQASQLDDDVGRLEGMSRTTGQLIWVLPADVPATSASYICEMQGNGSF